jgi:hypothetical protein
MLCVCVCVCVCVRVHVRVCTHVMHILLVASRRSKLISTTHAPPHLLLKNEFENVVN